MNDPHYAAYHNGFLEFPEKVMAHREIHLELLLSKPLSIKQVNQLDVAEECIERRG